MLKYYSQRMLNPYHGLVQVVEVPGADAVSRDGVTWMLYIQGGSETEVGDDGRAVELALPDIKFGTWSARDGLRRAPVRFVTDYPQLNQLGEQLLGAVKSRLDRLPFPQADHYELWLLDATDGLPLALLDSRCHASDLEGFPVLRWNPGQAARNGFCAKHLNQPGSHAQLLAERVSRRAGTGPRAQWFARGDGKARGLVCSDPAAAFEGRELDLGVFPELLLTECWTTAQDSALAAAYLAWQSPWLLALQGLSRPTRQRLEQAARRRALLLAELYRTYPEVIDGDALQAARVEAALRHAAEEGDLGSGQSAASFVVTGN